MKTERHAVNTTSTANIAFAVVVLAVYFATFSAIRNIPLIDLFFLIIFGIGYLSIGIYGFSYVAKSELLYARVGYLIVQITLGGLIVTLGRGAGFSALILLPLAGHAVVLLTETWAYLANLTIVGAYIVSVGAYSGDRGNVWADLPIFLAGLIFIVVFTQVAVGEERSRREVERLNEELTLANEQLREYATKAEELAKTQERNRLAREIHDGLGHYLTTIHMEIQAANAVMAVNPPKAREMLSKAQALAQDALADVRTSVASLRLSAESTQPLPVMVERLLKNCETIGISTAVSVEGEAREINPKVQFTLFRIMQECVSNICKHSQASHASVKIDYTSSDWLRMEIADDGIGAEQIDGGFGLIGLQERVTLIGGEILIEAEQNRGFCVKVMVPS